MKDDALKGARDHLASLMAATASEVKRARLFVYGKRLYGRVQESSGTCVATLFFHVYFFPLWPLESHVVLEESRTGFRSMRRTFHWGSILAAYGGFWGPLVMIRAAGSVVWASGSKSALVPWAVIPIAVALAVLFVGSTRVGRLSAEQRAQRLVYGAIVGYPVDVALLGAAREGLATDLRAWVAERVKGLTAPGYRGGADPPQAWRAAAVDPAVDDEKLLDVAFTLARLEASLASGAVRASFRETHGRIWVRLRQSHLEMLREAEALGNKRRPWIGTTLAVALVAVLTGLVVWQAVSLDRDEETKLASYCASYSRKPGEPVNAQTTLATGTPVFVLMQRERWSDELWCPAGVVGSNADGSVRVTFSYDYTETTVARGKMRLSR
jgi:hypothetical protein